MNWKFWEKPPEQPIKLQPRPSYEVTLDEWRKNDNLVASAKLLHSNHTFKCMMDILIKEHPGRRFLPLGTDGQDRIALQARAEGYQLCLKNLMDMGEKQKKAKEPEEKWQPLPV